MKEAPKTLEQKVEELSNMIGPLYDYIRDSHKQLVEQIKSLDANYHDLRTVLRDVSLLQRELERQMNEVRSLRSGVVQSVDEFRVLVLGLETKISRAEAVAESLDKLLNSPRKIVVTRPAQPHELRDPATVPVRQASHAEIRALAEME